MSSSVTPSAAGAAPDGPTGAVAIVDGPPPRLWWLVLISGLLAVLVGVLALAVPGATILFLGLLFGVSLMISGVGSIALGLTGDGSAGRQTLSVLLGFAAVLAGIFCFVRPGAGIIAVLLSVSFWFMLVGIGDLVAAFQEKQHRFWRGLLGVIAIAAGVVLVVDPVIGLETVALLAGLGFLLRGGVEIGFALQLRKAAKG
jgi:uncharacterized membrane protein HdeD (DUF308 family)